MASAEDIELYLDEGLYLDVKISDEWKEKYQSNGQQQQHRLPQLPQSPSQQLPQHIQPQTPTPAHVQLRRWNEAVVLQVQRRSIKIHYLTAKLPDEWIDIDCDSHRLAELHSMTERESQGITEIGNADMIVLDDSELNNEVTIREILDRTDLRVTFKESRRAFVQRWLNSTSHSVPPSTFDFTSSYEVPTTSSTDDVFSESIVVPLWDPLTHCTLSIPVRSSHCKHTETFDLLTHIIHNRTRVIWTCPMCKQDSLIDDLQVDTFLAYIALLISSPAVQHFSSISSAGLSDLKASLSLTSLPFTVNSHFEERRLRVYCDDTWAIVAPNDLQLNRRTLVAPPSCKEPSETTEKAGSENSVAAQLCFYNGHWAIDLTDETWLNAWNPVVHIKVKVEQVKKVYESRFDEVEEPSRRITRSAFSHRKRSYSEGFSDGKTEKKKGKIHRIT